MRPVVLASTAGDESVSLDDIKNGLHSALKVYSKGLTARTLDDPVPVLAMPLVGTAEGGFNYLRGEAVATILESLDAFFVTYKGLLFDIMIVCHNASDYAAVQLKRRRVSPGLPLRLAPLADGLTTAIRAATNRHLGVLFGTGVSAQLRLPAWPKLLENLAHEFEVPLTKEQLERLDPVDAASLLVESAGTDDAFLTAIQRHLPTPQASLLHMLLAGIQPLIAVTTNYDAGYEMAVRGQGRTCSVLPWEQPTGVNSTLLLRLHGDVEHGSVVLSRDHFMTMQGHRRPLGSMVQERMLAGHLLTIGSSMSDPTLVQAAEEVASLIRTVRAGDRRSNHHSVDPAAHQGTVILPNDDPARRMLLERSFDVIIAAKDEPDIWLAGRDVAILIDYLAMRSSRSLAFVLNEAYNDILNTLESHYLMELLRDLRWTAQAGRESEDPQHRMLAEAVLRALEPLQAGPELPTEFDH